MPVENNFFHSKYTRADPGERARHVSFEPGAPLNSQAWQDGMADAGEVLRQAGVRGLILLHGSPLETDLFGSERLDDAGGLKRGYSRGIPGLESLLAQLRPSAYRQKFPASPIALPLSDDPALKTKLDSLVCDTANFTNAYLGALEKGINRNGATPIHCTRYLWSSLHHHIGRVEAAIAFLEYLQDFQRAHALSSGDRILILGHGHAGLVLSLLSNCLAPGESFVRQSIIESLQAYYAQVCDTQSPYRRALEGWETLLANAGAHPLPILDLVTLGTPVRYGWDTGGIGHLLHVVNHRPLRADGKNWLAKMELPQVAWELPTAAGGDYVQQLAVAGTDALPQNDLEKEINQTLREFLEPYDGFERWLECARRSIRCANDGLCLLVDYQDGGSDQIITHLFGHACYTRLAAMLFQTRLLVDYLYLAK